MFCVMIIFIKLVLFFLVVACLWLITWCEVVWFDDCDAVLLCLIVVGYCGCTLSVLPCFGPSGGSHKLCLWTVLHYDLVAIKNPGAYTCSNVRERVGWKGNDGMA